MPEFDFDGARKRGNRFGPGVHVSPEVNMGESNVFGPNCVVTGTVSIGSRNHFAAGVTLGSVSRQRARGDVHGSLPSQRPRIAISDDNVFEDYVTIHLPVSKITSIGSRSTLGAYTHVAHDVTVRDDVITTAHCSLGGWVILAHWCNLGMSATIHPRCIVGAYAMIGAGTVVINHVRPGAMVAGVPARYLKPNDLGMRRAGLSAAMRDGIARRLNNQAAADHTATPYIAELYRQFQADQRSTSRNRPSTPPDEVGQT